MFSSVIFFLCAYKALIIIAFCSDLKIEIVIAILGWGWFFITLGRNRLLSSWVWVMYNRSEEKNGVLCKAT